MKIDEKLIGMLANAVRDALSKDYKFDEAFDWNLLYYIIRPAMHLSENEFWNSTPKKLLEFLKVLENYKKQQQELAIIEDQNRAVDAVMSW